QEVGATEELEQFFAFSGLRSYKDVLKETLRLPVGHLVAGLDRGMRNCLGNMAYPGAGVANQESIGGLLHKLPADQFQNLLFREAGIIRPVKILHDLPLIQPGAVKAPLNQSGLPAVQFILDKL